MAKLKGNLVILQSGGPTAAINSSVAGVVFEALEHAEINGIYGAINGVLGVLNEELVDLGRERLKRIYGLNSTPSSALGSCRYKVGEEDLEQIFEVIKAHNIRYFLIAGGNDSMDTGNKVVNVAKDKNYELRIIGIPKTVDNDLCYTDHCPGYPSIARWLAIATRDAGLDTEAIYTSDTVKIIETMGRNTGWVTASTALAKENENDAPHLIYLPERPFSQDIFLKDVEAVYRRLGYCVVAVCEGLKNEKGQTLVESKKSVDADGFGHGQRGGVGQYLCDLIAENLGVKARSDKPGTIQRVSMACASEIDLQEAFRLGKKAVEYAVLKEYSGFMLGITRESSPDQGDALWHSFPGYYSGTILIPLEKVANKTQEVPGHFINSGGNFVSPAFIDWAKPLIGKLLKYTRLQKFFIKKKLNNLKDANE